MLLVVHARVNVNPFNYNRSRDLHTYLRGHRARLGMGMGVRERVGMG